MVAAINENNPANGLNYVDRNIQHVKCPKNFSAINQSCLHLPPAVVNDIMNQAYYFNDVKKTNSLIKVLEANKVFKSLPETDRLRVNIIRKLDVLFKQWLNAKQIKRPLILPYGSYQLGVQDETSDLDLLCIAPESKSRDDWISNFYAILQSQNEIQVLQTVPTASIPIIQLKLNGIEIQLAFVQLNIKNIPISLNLRTDSSLVGLDQQSRRTLNAWHATEKILQMVPNVKLFKFTLRAIRLWAKRNRLYSNKLGYFGGISWAILVAKTCLLYPTLDAAGLIHKFFFMYANWEWRNAVYLVHPYKTDGNTSYSYNLHAQTFVMPIMTPTYPQENSACNVTLSNSYRLRAAFSHAYCIVDGIMMGKATKCNLGWQTLFQASDLMKNYDHFIVVSAHSGVGAQHYKWQNHIEYKLVNFLRALERNPYLMPCVDTISYRKKNLKQGEDCSIWFIGLANPPLSFVADDCIELSNDTREDMAEFERLSSKQAESNGFGNVKLEIQYMCRKECEDCILPDLEIRN